MEMGATWRGRAWTCSADGDLYEHAGIAIPLGQGHNRATVVFNAKRAHIHGVVRGAWHWSCKHCDARSTEIGGAYNCTGHSVNECRVSTQMSRKNQIQSHALHVTSAYSSYEWLIAEKSQY